MYFQQKLLFIIIGVCSLASLGTATCACKRKQCSTECFDCTRCNYDCYQECGSPFSDYLCDWLIQQCKIDHDCNKPTTSVTIYPANDNTAHEKPEYEAKTFNMRENCCYDYTGIHDNTLSNIKINGACVKLYSEHGCTGSVLTLDSNFPCPLSSTNVITLDCPARIQAGGVRWNDVPSSMRLC